MEKNYLKKETVLSKQGFTIVEMMIVLLIFSLLSISITNVFLFSLRNKRYAVSSYSLLNQTSYASEYMSKMIRMARRNDSDLCTGTKNFIVSDSNRRIKFLNYKNNCVEFYLQDKEIMVKIDSEVNNLTSEKNMIVEKMEFILQNDDVNKQPRVTVLIVAEGTGALSAPEIRLQTTLSQRDLNIESEMGISPAP